MTDAIRSAVSLSPDEIAPCNELQTLDNPGYAIQQVMREGKATTPGLVDGAAQSATPGEVQRTSALTFLIGYVEGVLGTLYMQTTGDLRDRIKAAMDRFEIHADRARDAICVKPCAAESNGS